MSRISILLTLPLIIATILLSTSQLSASGLGAGQATASWPSNESVGLAEISTGTNPVDLSITKTPSASEVIVGTNLTYTLLVINHSTEADAQNVIVTDILPANVTFKSVSSTKGSCSGSNTISCPLGTLAKGQQATVTIVVTPRRVGQITNTATVVSDNPDSQTGNNSDTVVTRALAQVYLPVITK